jgi:pimeloyl-ACP methyl ester carboxylesterase
MGDASRLRQIAAVSATLVGLIYAVRTFVQPKLLYFPRAYVDERGYAALWNNAVARVSLSNSRLLAVPYNDKRSQSSARTCYLLLAPPSKTNKQPLWIVHGGNAMTALDWLPSLLDSSRGQTSFLLIDLPGYGRNEPLRQHPESEEAVLSNSLSALDAALQVMQKESRAASETNLLGHSLGSGVALLLGNALLARSAVCENSDRAPPPVLPINKVLLSAPFVSVPSVAQTLMGPLPLVLYKTLCSHAYNNEANLPSFLAASPSSQVTIIHGNRDEIVSISHSRALAKANPKVRLVEVDGAHHNDIMSTHWHLYHSILVEPGAHL